MLPQIASPIPADRQASIRLGRCTYCRRTRSLRRDDGQITSLTLSQYCVLELLLRNRGRCMGAEEMAQELATSCAAIKMIVSRLRVRLGIAAGEHLISTIKGRGYQLLEAARDEHWDTSRASLLSVWTARAVVPLDSAAVLSEALQPD